MKKILIVCYNFFSLLALVLSAYLSFLVIPRLVFVSVKRRLFDVPNSRSSHTRAVPRLGGIIFLPLYDVFVCFLY